MADINNSGFNSGSRVNLDVNNGLSGLSSDVSSSSFSATSTSESFASTPRYTGTENEMANQRAASNDSSATGYRQYLDKGADYITRGMDAVTPAFNRTVESLRPVVSRGMTSARTQAEANPWITVGVAAGVSMFIGYLLGRSFATERSPYADYNYGMSNTVGSTTTPNVGVDVNNGNTDRIASDNLGTNPSY
jgi:ElaB/YqjD/DUF883 family membrane-anchored ribosome-binding protein